MIVRFVACIALTAAGVMQVLLATTDNESHLTAGAHVFAATLFLASAMLWAGMAANNR